MNKIRNIVLGLIVIIFASSCVHKKLCYDHIHTVNLRVNFDWQNAPEATPKTMIVYLYPNTGEAPLRYDLAGKDGGIIRVPFGNYTALCVNGETDNLEGLNNSSPYTFELTTKQTSLLGSLGFLGVKSESAPRANGTEDEEIKLQPDEFWYDVINGIELTKDKLEDNISLSPRETFCTYNVEIRNVENLKYVNGVSFALSSLSGGVRLCDDKLSEELVTVPFDGFFDLDSEVIRGKILTFGHCPTIDREHKLIVYVILKDETKWYYTYDVTSKLHDAPDQRNIDIVLSEIPIPRPITNGGGFQPTIEEWTTVEIDISM